MQYKLIGIDMDGTLLNNKHEITERTKNVLKAVNDKGIQVVICTGRIFPSAKYYAKLLGLITPIISGNGSYVCEYHRDNVLYEAPMEFDDCKEVIKILEENDIYYHFHDVDNFYTRELNYKTLEYHNWNKKQKPSDRINIEILDNTLDFLDKNDLKILKIVAIDKNQDKLDRATNELRKNKNLEIVSSVAQSFDVMKKGVSKGRALEKLCNLSGIKSEEVIAIGDNYNDIPMFEFAGTSVVMKNGEDGAKEKADIIADTNDNEGVAKILEELILNR